MNKSKDKKVHAFPKTICPKVKLIVSLDFEPTYYNVAVEHVSHNTMRIYRA